MIASRLVRLAAPISRVAAARPAFMAVRSFASPSAPLMQDILKDLYIKELKGYKPAPEAKGTDASSQVKEFKAPAAPASHKPWDIDGRQQIKQTGLDPGP
ncbi:hypothetical protein BGZ97_002031, partial [Linnemannia gamsii]